MQRRIVAICLWAPCFLAAVLSVGASANGQAVRVTDAFGEPPKPADVLELFNAIEEDVVDARVIVRDQFHAKIVLENLTDLPVALNIPNFLAAQPILAQPILAQQGFFGQPGGGQQGLGTTAMSNGSSVPQSVGGPTSSRGLSANSGFPGGGPVFNIAPEQVRTIDLPCFCLEYGKPNPRAAIKYELVPLQQANDDPRLPGLLAAYARGEIERDAAQAAVWHAANGMSWDELAGISQSIAINADQPLFNSVELRNAKALVDAVAKRTAEVTKVAVVKKSAVVREPTTETATPTKRSARRDKDRI